MADFTLSARTINFNGRRSSLVRKLTMYTLARGLNGAIGCLELQGVQSTRYGKLIQWGKMENNRNHLLISAVLSLAFTQAASVFTGSARAFTGLLSILSVTA